MTFTRNGEFCLYRSKFFLFSCVNGRKQIECMLYIAGNRWILECIRKPNVCYQNVEIHFSFWEVNYVSAMFPEQKHTWKQQEGVTDRTKFPQQCFPAYLYAVVIVDKGESRINYITYSIGIESSWSNCFSRIRHEKFIFKPLC